MSDETPVVIVHPEDINQAHVKALAALHGASVIGNRFVKRGNCYLFHPSAFLSGAVPEEGQ